MLEVKTYNQEKNTWNVKIHNKNHEIKIDIWNDLYVDGELLGPFREFFQMDLNTNRSKYVFKVDGENIKTSLCDDAISSLSYKLKML